MKLSVILPCFNEESVIEQTYQVLRSQLQQLDDMAYEIICVNDGSTDRTLVLLKQLAKADAQLKYVSFSRNFGKESAMLAGLKAATGDAVVLMDADLQHPPTLLQAMIEKYNAGYDQVIATRTRTGDNARKTLLSRLYYRLVNRLTDVEMRDGAGDFRLMSRRVVDALLAMPEYNRFSKGLFSWVGYQKYYLPYENVSRAAGESKFSMKHLLNYGIHGVMSFNDKPLRLCINMGLIILSLCLVYIIAMAVEFFTKGVSSNGYFTTMTAILLIGGVQLLSVGVLGEYIGKIYYEVKKRPHYIVEESNTAEK